MINLRLNVGRRLAFEVVAKKTDGIKKSPAV